MKDPQYNCGIYKITNIVNGKVYIGCAINFKSRFRRHKNTLRTNTHRNKHLQRAWNKYGESNFSFDIILVCAEQDLDSSELYFIKAFNSVDRDIGYNIKLGGSTAKGKDHPSFGIPVPEERKQKIREARAKQSATQNMINTLIQNQKSWKGITGENHCSFGCKHSKEAIERTSKAKWKAVLQIDPITNQIINRFDNIKDAAIKIGQKSHGNISMCCNGVRKMASGFIWRFE